MTTHNCKCKRALDDMKSSIKDIVEEKVRTFSEIECLDKLIEELTEAKVAAVLYQNNLKHQMEETTAIARVDLAEELADVFVAGILTLGTLRPFMQAVYDAKVHRGVFKQMKTAIEQKCSN